MNKDPIISDLVRKKKELLNQLLAVSIQTAIGNKPENMPLTNRAQIVSALSINDQALKSRERALNISADGQEPALFNDIKSILTAINDNNNQTINRLEVEIKQVEREQSRLNRGNKLTGYINQQKRYQNSTALTSNKHSRHSGNRLLNGTL